MKPVSIQLTQEQHQRLQTESRRTGLAISDLVRRAIDAAYPPTPRETAWSASQARGPYDPA